MPTFHMAVLYFYGNCKVSPHHYMVVPNTLHAGARQTAHKVGSFLIKTTGLQLPRAVPVHKQGRCLKEVVSRLWMNDILWQCLLYFQYCWPKIILGKYFLPICFEFNFRTVRETLISLLLNHYTIHLSHQSIYKIGLSRSVILVIQ